MTEVLVTSSVLILVVTALRYLLRGRISLRLQYALWGLVLLRLVLPVSLISSPVSVMNVIQTAAGSDGVGTILTQAPAEAVQSNAGAAATEAVLLTPAENGSAANAADASHSGVAADGTAGLTADREGSGFGGLDVLRVVWLAGCAAALLWLLASNLRFARTLRRNRKKLEGLVSPLPVYVCGGIDTPCLFGLFCPAIYVTPQAAADEEALRHCVAHESAHYRHRDHLWSLLRGLCLAVYWFDPLVWLAAILSRRDGELACDEAAIRSLGEAARMAYGRTLITMTCEKRPALLCTATTMTGSQRSLKERITLIAKKPKMAIYTLIAVVLIAAALVGCTFTGASQADSAALGADTCAYTSLYNTVVRCLTDGGVETVWQGYRVDQVQTWTQTDSLYFTGLAENEPGSKLWRLNLKTGEAELAAETVTGLCTDDAGLYYAGYTRNASNEKAYYIAACDLDGVEIARLTLPDMQDETGTLQFTGGLYAACDGYLIISRSPAGSDAIPTLYRLDPATGEEARLCVGVYCCNAENQAVINCQESETAFRVYDLGTLDYAGYPLGGRWTVEYAAGTWYWTRLEGNTQTWYQADSLDAAGVDLNLAEFLRNFPKGSLVTDEAEFAALQALENCPFSGSLSDMPVPVHKYARQDVDAALNQYAGITTADLTGVGGADILYLEAYDAYYNFTSDAGIGMFPCTSGYLAGDTAVLYSESGSGGLMALTLRQAGETWYIVSHQLVTQHEDEALEVVGADADAADSGSAQTDEQSRWEPTAVNWALEDTDVTVPLDLTALFDETQGAYAVPGVVWGTDKDTLLERYGVHVLSEYPINNPELWFTLELDGAAYRLTPVFGFDAVSPCCNLYANNRVYTAQELETLSQALLEHLTELFGQPELDELDNEALQYSDDPAAVWHADFCDWRAQTPEGNTSILSLAVTTCNDAVQEIELDFFFRYAD